MKLSRWRDNSGRLCVSVDGVPSLMYRWYAWKLRSEFGLKKEDRLFKGADEIFQKYIKATMSVSIDWDTRLGFTVTALDRDAEQLVSDIARYLQNNISDLKEKLSKDWIEAAKILGADPTREVLCPQCGEKPLKVNDSAVSDSTGVFERSLTCEICGAQNVMRKHTLIED